MLHLAGDRKQLVVRNVPRKGESSLYDCNRVFDLDGSLLPVISRGSIKWEAFAQFFFFLKKREKMKGKEKKKKKK